MSEILRTRVIRPTTRKVTSTSYKIDTKPVGLNDKLRVEISHESKPGRWVFTFSGQDIKGRDSISFRVSEMNDKVDISWSGLQPLNRCSRILAAPAQTPASSLIPTKETKTVSSRRKTSFPPVIAEGCNILVLGTMPGEKSLELQQYYAHPRNRFWSVIASILNEPAPSSYDERKQWLMRNKVALWDVASQCERHGSLDSNIRDEEPNNLEWLMKSYSTIRCIAFNGTSAERMYSRFFKQVPAIAYCTLPSTSPANTVPKTYILEKWSVLKLYNKGSEQ